MSGIRLYARAMTGTKTATIDITKRFTFEAAHYFGHMPEGHGYRRVHGHSYVVDVTIAGVPDPDTGWIADFDALAKAMDGVRNQLDHNLLNEVEGLENPSLEHIAQWIAGSLQQTFPGLVSVQVGRPSCGESCTYRLDHDRFRCDHPSR